MRTSGIAVTLLFTDPPDSVEDSPKPVKGPRNGYFGNRYAFLEFAFYGTMLRRVAILL